ncbi:lanthionine synthetase C family protein [Nonomuraea fuscirosea]|uniref:lanthionine synthetase C family protein n=1 Tax=Nonomuraea fuscirosea TaxID=1291556 RepID=UPI0037AA611A
MMPLAGPHYAAEAMTTANRIADALATPPPPDPGDDYTPSSPRWRHQSLSKGAAGIALLHAVRAHAGLAGWERVDAWLECATREEINACDRAGLWFGAPSLAFAMAATAPSGRYRSALRTLDASVAMIVKARLAAARARMAAVERPTRDEFDLVRGMTGLGAHLLRRNPNGLLVRDVLAYLVQLTQPLSAWNGLPGWWTIDIPPGRPPADFRGGFADHGMAHGIAGPLALLATSMRRGITVQGHAEAIERICDWLDYWWQESPAGPWWPERVNIHEHLDGRPTRPGPARPSWCYGTPGIARALQLAGIATGDHARQQRAELALAACLSDPAQFARIRDPALCHGWAGVLATVWHASADDSTGQLVTHLPGLLATLLHHADQAEHDGLIEGRTGIALLLHTMTARTSTCWEPCLLIT